MLPFKDISENQGVYNMALNTDPIIAIRMSTGELMRFDHEASRNYANAAAAGKRVLNYHYAGHNDPMAEAKLFIAAVHPFDKRDAYCLDAELGQTKAWKQAFADYIHQQTGAYVFDYMNISTANALKPLANSPLWLAAPSWGFTETITQLDPSIIYVAQQGPIVNGVDTNMWFGTLDQFDKCCYQPPSPAPAPVTPPTPVAPENVPTPTQQGSEQSANTQPEPVPPTAPTQTSPKTNTPPSGDTASIKTTPSQNSTSHISQVLTGSWWTRLWDWLKGLFRW